MPSHQRKSHNVQNTVFPKKEKGINKYVLDLLFAVIIKAKIIVNQKCKLYTHVFKILSIFLVFLEHWSIYRYDKSGLYIFTQSLIPKNSKN